MDKWTMPTDGGKEVFFRKVILQPQKLGSLRKDLEIRSYCIYVSKFGYQDGNSRYGGKGC